MNDTDGIGEHARRMVAEARAKPKLPATAVYAELKRPSTHAAFVRIKVMDSKGDSYYFDAACFHYDLKPWEPA